MRTSTERERCKKEMREKKKERKEHETSEEKAKRKEKREKETRTTSDTSAQMQALENQIAELLASHAMLTKKIRNLEPAWGGKGGSGSGLVQMHADFHEQYKDKLDLK